MIKQLGGKFIDTTSFVEGATHVIAGYPNTGEKYMGGLMTGKWLLRPEYIQDSHTSGRWLGEMDYEWSSQHLSNRFVILTRLGEKERGEREGDWRGREIDKKLEREGRERLGREKEREKREKFGR